MDKAFQERFTTGLLQLMVDITVTEEADGTRTAVVPAAECIDAMLSAMAVLLRDSEATATPTKTREMCNVLASKLRKRILAAKQQPAPFATITLPETTN